jgi:FKBP-type peptidyl-prolyl cis-trans isomerase
MTLFYSCKKYGNLNVHESGLEYRIIKGDKTDGKKLQLGNLVMLNMSYETEKGLILFNSESSDRKYLRSVLAPTHSGGSFEDGLLLLSEGDSAVFKINAENFLIYTEGFKKLPKDVKYDDNIIVKLRVIDVVDKDEYEYLLSERYHSSEDTEMNILEKYLDNANIKVKPTESGLYYIETEKGNGRSVQENDLLHVHYTVKYIDGNLIETTLGQEPLKYTYGTSQFIKGWDEGIGYMHEGGKATLIVPSRLAYGSEGNNKILPYSTLVFDIELIRIQ